MDIKENALESPFQLLKTFVSSLEIQNACVDYSVTSSGNRAIDVGYNIENVVRTNENLHCAQLSLTIKISIETEDCKLNLAMTIHGIFVGEASIDDARFTEMLQINGCSALYSIARGCIGSITSQMFSSGNIIIPLVNFVRFHEIERQSS